MWTEAPDDNTRCPICRKPLPPRDDWGYRIGGADYCSYGCMRKAEAAYKASNEYREICTQLGGTTPPVNYLHRKREVVIPENELAAWARMLKDGCTVRQIAQRFRRSYDFVHLHLSQRGLLPPGCNKLTWQQASAIRERAKVGESLKGLAEEFGVHPYTVQRIINGETYRDDDE